MEVEKKIRPNLSSLRVSAARVEPKFISLLHTHVFLLLSLTGTYICASNIHIFFLSHTRTRTHIYIYNQTCEHIFRHFLFLSLTHRHTHAQTYIYKRILSHFISDTLL